MALTPETFQNLERDIDDTGKTPNTDAVIIPRYGSPYKSLPMVSREGKKNLIQQLMILKPVIMHCPCVVIGYLQLSIR